MTNGAAADERFGNLMHLDGALYASVHAFFFEGVLQSEGVDDRSEHAHKIAGSAIDFKSLLTRAAKNVSAADHDGHFHAQRVDVFQLSRDGLDGFSMNAKSLRALEGLAGKFEQDAFVNRLGVVRQGSRRAFRAGGQLHCFRLQSFRWHVAPVAGVKSSEL